MTDILSRLSSTKLFGNISIEMCSLLADAIIEIERLRTTIANLQQIAGKASIDGQTFAQIKGDAKAAKIGAPNG